MLRCASRLVLGQNTVRNYVSNIFSKLQVVDRARGHYSRQRGRTGG